MEATQREIGKMSQKIQKSTKMKYIRKMATIEINPLLPKRTEVEKKYKKSKIDRIEEFVEK